MAKYTTKYNFKKPDKTDYFNVDDFNDNWDKAESALNTKVSSEMGKGLSDENYTLAEKNKLKGIETGANKYIHPRTHSADMIDTTPLKRFVSDVEKNKWNKNISTEDADGKYALKTHNHDTLYVKKSNFKWDDLAGKPDLVTESELNSELAYKENVRDSFGTRISNTISRLQHGFDNLLDKRFMTNVKIQTAPRSNPLVKTEVSTDIRDSFLGKCIKGDLQATIPVDKNKVLFFEFDSNNTLMLDTLLLNMATTGSRIEVSVEQINSSGAIVNKTTGVVSGSPGSFVVTHPAVNLKNHKIRYVFECIDEVNPSKPQYYIYSIRATGQFPSRALAPKYYHDENGRYINIEGIYTTNLEVRTLNADKINTAAKIGDVENYGVASKTEAEAGAVNNKYMTPLRTKESILANTNDVARAGEIPEGADLNDYKEPGYYTQSFNAHGSSMINCPTELAFGLLVFKTTNAVGRTQVLREYIATNPRTFIRSIYGSSVGEWQEIAKLEDVKKEVNAAENRVNKQVQILSKTIRPADFIATTSAGDYKYMITISDVNIDSETVVDVNFDVADINYINDLGICSATKSVNGKVMLFTEDKANRNVLATLILHKGVD